MKVSNDSVFVGATLLIKGEVKAGLNTRASSRWKAVLARVASAVMLGGCLLGGDASESKLRNEALSSINESNGASEGAAPSGSGRSGGAGRPTVLRTSAIINASVQADHYPGTENYSKKVDLPSCDAVDAVRISTVAGLSQINKSNYRVFCIAPGDYRSAGKLALSGAGGTADAPKVIRFENSEFSSSDEIFTADVSKLARMPQIDIRNTSHWILNRLAFIEVSGMPIRMAGAGDIVIDRIRLEHNRNGIEIQHGTHDSYVQNSYIGNQKIPKGTGNDGVCVAFVGHYYQHNLDGDIDYSYPVVASNNHIVNNEIFNCNDGIQLVWMPQYLDEPDFHGTVMAGNDIYIDHSVRTNCSGSKSEGGDCAYTENAIDLKAGSLVPSSPVLIFDNRMWGWRKTDSVYNKPADSWGTAIGTHFSPVQNVEIYNNVIWDVASGIGFTRGSKNSVIRDNIITNVTSAGVNTGIALVTYSDSGEPNVSGIRVERNHVIHSGGAWLSSSATHSVFKCNVVANGGYTSTTGSWSVGLKAGQNTYYNTRSGKMSHDSDRVHSSFGSSNMGELCFKIKKASIVGGEEMCLSEVLNTPNSPNICASEYWSTANW